MAMCTWALWRWRPPSSTKQWWLMRKTRRTRPVGGYARRVAPRARPSAAVRDETASEVTAAPSRAPPFLVAAVGASAGGLEAFSSLLRAVPTDAQLAFILVQHLARDQRSILPELLGNVTPMTVVAARNERAIEPRHVYVIPPDARMTVSDGHLRVRPSSAEREAEGTVDGLFRSVAAEYRERAIGVVLSGGAHDGSAGVREIKAVGGLTLVQQPEQAAVDGMPRSAIATGAVDAVLPVEEIGDQLARLAKNPFFSRGDDAVAPEAPADVSHLLQIFQLLRRASGIDFNSYKLPTLKRRIERRIAFHRLPGLDAYVEVLQRDPAELQRLQDELLIHVTSFFREPAAFEALERLVLRPLLTRPPEGSTFRFWVAGCSTGEEAYSLAMIALELLDERAAAVSLQVFGTDVSEGTVEKARAGFYPASIAADVSPQRLRRFFNKSEGGYRISKEVRDRCVFARQDVTRDPPFSKLDLVICRNLLIYLNQATQRKVLGILHYALRPNGVLMLGGSESIGSRAELFAAFAKKSQLYRKKGDGSRPEMESIRPAPPQAASPAKQSAPKRPADRSPWDVQTDANRVLLDRYAPPAVIVDEDLRIVRSRGGTSPFLELPAGEATVEHPQDGSPGARIRTAGGAPPGARPGTHGGQARPTLQGRRPRARGRPGGGAPGGRNGSPVPGSVRGTTRGAGVRRSRAGSEGGEARRRGAFRGRARAGGDAPPAAGDHRRARARPTRSSSPRTRRSCRATRSCSRPTRSWIPPRRSCSRPTKS